MKFTHPLHIIGPALALATLLAGCSEPAPQAPAQVSESPVLARVNGEPITEQDVQFLIEKTFSQADQLQLNDAVLDKVVQSLVVSKAMQQAAKAEMGDDERQQLALRVRAYEEELYVQAYLQQHAVATPVTTEMIDEYYHANLDQFGAVAVKSFHLLVAEPHQSELQRDQFLADAPKIKAIPHWPDHAKDWAQRYGVKFQQAEATPGLLEADLAQLLAPLSVGQNSDIRLIDGQPHLMRVVSERNLPAKPLSEVSNEIRKRLAPQQLRAAIKAASADVLANTQVEYLTK